MSQSIPPGPPTWVYKRDGRLVPFETDKISQALFAASETLGRPDAFLARELSDGVVHFLAAETAGATPTSAQIAELIIKIVRELGQPALSGAFAEGNRRRWRSTETPAVSPAGAGPDAGKNVVIRFSTTDAPTAVVQHCLREYSLQAIFGRDLVAAHRDGLLTLTGLEAPLELAGCVFDLADRGLERGPDETPAWAHSRRSGVLMRALQEMRRRAGIFLAVDGPEYALTPFASASDLAKNSGELAAGLEATGLSAVVNLNCAQPPGWAEEPVEGPLFADQRRSSPAAHVEEYRSVLLEQLLRPAFAGRLRIDWHLSDRDFQGQTNARLLRLARLAVESPFLGFAFDRLRQATSLAEGLGRKHPAVLVAVGLNLPRLLELPEVGGEPECFLLKLASLTRMAVSAAVQKRNFLRRHSRGQDRLARAFLLDRARLVVVPIGLEAAVVALAGHGICAGDTALELARQILSSLSANLRQAGHAASLDGCVDGLCCAPFAAASGFSLLDGPGDNALPLSRIAGPTCWGMGADLKTQLKAAGLLHAAADTGTAAVLIPQDQVPGGEELVDLLHYAWQRTEVARIRFLRVPHQQQQLAW